MAKTADQVAAKWQRNLAASTQDMTAGVAAVSVNPMDKAIAQIPVMVQNLQAAAQSGKIEAGMRRVSLSQWKDSMTKKGIPRVASGATAAQPKVQAFMQQLLPHVQAGQNMLDSMPRGSPAQNDARLLAWINHMRQFKRS